MPLRVRCRSTRTRARGHHNSGFILVFKMNLNKLFITAALTLFSLAQAQTTDYPNKPIKLVVPFPAGGSSPAMIDLISGQVNVMLTTMASAGGHVRAGKLRALATTGAKRHPDFPDVPTLVEVGIKGVDYEQWFGIMGPAGMSKPVTDKLAGAIAQVLQMQDVREKLGVLGLEIPIAGAEEMGRKVSSDTERWARLAKELDIKPLE